MFLVCKEQAYETMWSVLHKTGKQKDPVKEENVQNFEIKLTFFSVGALISVWYIITAYG